MVETGAPAGRGAYREASDVERLVSTCRRSVADLLEVSNPNRIIFTFNGTDSLNLAIHGMVKPGDHVISTNVEHNSVLRPLNELRKKSGVDLTLVECGPDTLVDADRIAAAIKPETKLICLVHASNVTGAIQRVGEVGRVAREHGIPLLVDAAQSLGHIDVGVEKLGADLVAAPGHKGLFGPLGTGILYVGEGVDEQIESIRQGGTGSASDSPFQPDDLPDKFESGNLNVPGIAGLKAGVEFVKELGIEKIRRHEQGLLERLIAGLGRVPGVTVFGPASLESRCGAVSFIIGQIDSRECAAMLDSAFRIQVRAGFHCAAMVHESLRTMQNGGTIRLSPGWFNTAEQIDAVIESIHHVADALNL